MKPRVTIRTALSDPQLLGGALPGESWAIWRTLLIAAMGEALTDDERNAFAAVTGRDREPPQRVDEIWCVVGRRGGKTRAAGTLAAYVATLCDWTDKLAPGERGVLPILAASTSQADRAFQHVLGVLQHSPVLSGQIIGQPTSDTIRLSNMIDVMIKPANFRTVRSITAVAAIADELAFWQIEGSKNPDREILAALRPALITTGGPLMVISSPYARRGELFRAYRSDYGPEGDPSLLVAKGPSKVFNSTLPQSEIDKAFKRDPSSATAEYGGEFRIDVETLLVRETVEAAVDLNTTERPRLPGVHYYGFVDPSGGSADSMTLAVGHLEGTKAVIDRTIEKRPPFSPEGTTDEFAAVLASFGINRVVGDRYGGEWCREPFRRRGIEYALSDAPKSELYLALVPALNSGRVALLDNDRVIDQLVGLERRTSNSGRDSVDHAPGGHDDVANAIAGVVFMLLQQQPAPTIYVGSYSRGPSQNQYSCTMGTRDPFRELEAILEEAARTNNR
ncbi:hypothetical protein [Mesorhizobium carmichaelinearum]|uniref:hypothetical protein n=1 Tax=Mesorhizobium carmichaelinearum TaxID=1208188 RepID=UPI0015CBF777|nr:hypothetical protein [Mesorhizobium carmichaelinearum]